MRLRRCRLTIRFACPPSFYLWGRTAWESRLSCSCPSLEGSRSDPSMRNSSKILFYDFRQKVPDLDPLNKTGLAVEPRGAELSEQAIIATSPKPRSKHLFIPVPTPKIRDSPGYRLYRHPGLHGADISSSASHH
jgi:hypothetical protein